MSKVLTVGTFDMPHSGHVKLFERCRKLADLVGGEVVVGVNTDEFVEKYKGAKPVYSYAERYAIVASNKYVDRVIRNDAAILERMLINEKPTFLIIGSDWAKKDYYRQIGVSEDWLQKNGTMLIYVPYTEGVSSTQLKERLNKS